MLCDISSAELLSYGACSKHVSRTVCRNSKHTPSETFAANRKRQETKPSRTCFDRYSHFSQTAVSWTNSRTQQQRHLILNFCRTTLRSTFVSNIFVICYIFYTRGLKCIYYFLNIYRHYFHNFYKTAQHFWAHTLHIFSTFTNHLKKRTFHFLNTFLQDNAAILHSMYVVTKLILGYYTLTNLPSDWASAYTIMQNV